MQINFVLPSVGIAGGVRVVFEYANRLSKRGHDITVLHPVIPPRMDEQWLAPRSRLTQILGTIKRLSKNGSVSWFDLDATVQKVPTLSPSVIRYLDHWIPDGDAIVATSWETAYTVCALSESKGEKVHFIQHYEIWETWNSEQAWNEVSEITDEREAYPVQMYEITPENSDAKKQKELVDRAYRLPIPKITISSWLAELLETKFNKEVVRTIPNSVNHSTFYPDSASDSNGLRLLLPYRKAAWKGRREANYLIKEIRNSHDIEFHTYGPRRRPRDMPDGVVHHSNVSDAKLRQLYSDADIFVLPSWIEGCQLPPLEAMACECAVIATYVGGIPDYAEHNETAVLVPPRNRTALVNAVIELIENEEKRRRLQQQGRGSVLQYTWDEATEQFEDALNCIIQSNSHAFESPEKESVS